MDAGIAPGDVSVSRDSSLNDLILRVSGASETLTIKNEFLVQDGRYKVEQIAFADGTVWDVATIASRLTKATPGADTLTGFHWADTLDGLAGDDVLRGAEGDDRLQGSEGRDQLYGDAGDDALHGGTGDDYMEGGPGNDTFDGGSGNDRYYGDHWLYEYGGNDTYLFGRGDGYDYITDKFGERRTPRGCEPGLPWPVRPLRRRGLLPSAPRPSPSARPDPTRGSGRGFSDDSTPAR